MLLLLCLQLILPVICASQGLQRILPVICVSFERCFSVVRSGIPRLATDPPCYLLRHPKACNGSSLLSASALNAVSMSCSQASQGLQRILPVICASQGLQRILPVICVSFEPCFGAVRSGILFNMRSSAGMLLLQDLQLILPVICVRFERCFGAVRSGILFNMRSSAVYEQSNDKQTSAASFAIWAIGKKLILDFPELIRFTRSSDIKGSTSLADASSLEDPRVFVRVSLRWRPPARPWREQSDFLHLRRHYRSLSVHPRSLSARLGFVMHGSPLHIHMVSRRDSMFERLLNLDYEEVQRNGRLSHVSGPLDSSDI
ncbi:hypothetical protein J6590_072336 [Homalodisca vitripennis]|nr:hypothetical protein J6590_072336 [Homalodisca vitripennis]